MNPISLRDCSLFLIDGTGSNYIEVTIGEGNLQYSTRRNVEPVKSRGVLDRVREGEQDITDVQFQFVWEHIKSSGSDPPTIEEVLSRSGPASTWQSDSADLDSPFCIRLQLVKTKQCGSINDGETLTFFEFHYQELAHSLEDATVDCRGFSNRVKPKVTRP